MRNTSLEEELRSGKACVSTTVGDSMEPMLRNRKDTIIIEPVHGRLKRYDLPLYRRPDGKYVLHRILHVKKNGYVICGDNRWWKENVPDEWIVGVVTEFYRREEHIYITDRKYRLYSFMVRLLLDSCVDPSSETYFTSNKEEMNTGKK